MDDGRDGLLNRHFFPPAPVDRGGGRAVGCKSLGRTNSRSSFAPPPLPVLVRYSLHAALVEINKERKRRARNACAPHSRCLPAAALAPAQEIRSSAPPSFFRNAGNVVVVGPFGLL